MRRDFDIEAAWRWRSWKARRAFDLAIVCCIALPIACISFVVYCIGLCVDVWLR